MCEMSKNGLLDGSKGSNFITTTSDGVREFGPSQSTETHLGLKIPSAAAGRRTQYSPLVANTSPLPSIKTAPMANILLLPKPSAANVINTATITFPSKVRLINKPIFASETPRLERYKARIKEQAPLAHRRRKRSRYIIFASNGEVYKVVNPSSLVPCSQIRCPKEAVITALESLQNVATWNCWTREYDQPTLQARIDKEDKERAASYAVKRLASIFFTRERQYRGCREIESPFFPALEVVETNYHKALGEKSGADTRMRHIFGGSARDQAASYCTLGANSGSSIYKPLGATQRSLQGTLHQFVLKIFLTDIN